MLPGFCDVTVTVTRPAEVNDRGATVLSYDVARGAESWDVEGCSVQRDAARRTMTDRAAHADTTRPLYAPPGTDLRNGDMVAFGGMLYVIAGDPTEWESPTGAVSHVQADIEVWKG